MCGLVGVYGDVGFKVESLFEDLLQMNVIRGPHSTGIAILKDEDSAPKILKGVMTPTFLMNQKEYKKATNKIDNILMLGHNRWATTGRINKKNSHPFKKGSITLTHNGTLHSVYALEIKKKYETDSETITASISEHGIENTWKNVDGAATLVWWDKGNQSLNFLTNGKRPFHYGTLIGGRCIVWASEAWMLRGACERRGLKLEDDQVWYLPNNTLFTFKIKNNKVVHTTKKLEKFTWAGRVLKYTTPLNDTKYRNFSQSKIRTPITPINNHKVIVPFNNVGMLEAFVDRRKHVLPKKEDKNLACNQMTLSSFRGKYDKCVFCEDSIIDPTQYEVAVVVDDHNVVCGNCVMVAEMNDINITKEILLK